MTERTTATPVGVNHIVLNVRDIEESHRFWTEVVGFSQVGQLTPTKDRPNPPKMSSPVGAQTTVAHTASSIRTRRDMLGLLSGGARVMRAAMAQAG